MLDFPCGLISWQGRSFLYQGQPIVVRWLVVHYRLIGRTGKRSRSATWRSSPSDSFQQSTMHPFDLSKHQLALDQGLCPNRLVVGSLLSLRCNLQPVSRTFESQVQPGLVLLNPVIHRATNRILHSPQQEINWEPCLVTKHKKEWRLASGLVGVVL
ncbi:unnamed protein product [Merluccius merluccius]